MDKQKNYINKDNDRETICVILAKNGYTVRIGSEKNGNGKSKGYVEYSKEL